MVARKNPSPVTPQPKRSGLVSLRFRIRLRRPLPHDHAEGGRRRAVGGGGQEAATLPRRGSPPRRGGGDCDRRREGSRRGADTELSSRSTPARRGGGNGRRLEGGGGADRSGEGELWPGSPPPRLGRGDGGWRREGAGRSGDWELSSGLPPPPPLRQGGVDCRRRDSGGGHRGGYGELSAGSASAGGGAAGRGNEVVVVHTCHVCSKTFDRVKALHGHMRSCRAAAEKLSPVALRQERAKKQRVEKKADDEGLLARALERSWAGIGRRRRRRIPIHGGGDSRAPRAKWSRVAAQDRAPIAVILREVTGLQVGEEELDQPWVAEMVRAAQDLMSLSAGEAGFGPVADGHSEHMRLHYADQLLGAGKTSVWAAPSTASGLSLPNPAAAGRSPFVPTLLKQEGEPPEEMAMTGNGVPVYVPAATAFGSSLPAATSSSFPLAFTMPKQEEEKPPGVMAMVPRNGTRPRGGFRLFGVDIAEGPKEEPKE